MRMWRVGTDSGFFYFSTLVSCSHKKNLQNTIKLQDADTLVPQLFPPSSFSISLYIHTFMQLRCCTSAVFGKWNKPKANIKVNKTIQKRKLGKNLLLTTISRAEQHNVCTIVTEFRDRSSTILSVVDLVKLSSIFELISVNFVVF